MDRKAWMNRELSWIQFNLRVLEEAETIDTPLFERLKFISIYQSNFDEFYRVRVGSIHDKMLVSDLNDQNRKEKAFAEQLNDIFKATRRLAPRFDKAFSAIINSPENAWIDKAVPENLTGEEKVFLKTVFEKDIVPIISPFIVEKKHPFPFFANGMRVIGVTLSTKNGKIRFGFVPINHNFPTVIFLPTAPCRFILIEDLLKMYAHKIFQKFTVTERVVFTIIRNADIEESEGLYDFDVDFRQTMSKLIELRAKLAPVSLKYNGESDKLIAHLRKVLFLTKKQVIPQTAPLHFGFLSDIKKRLPSSEYASLYDQKVKAVRTPQIDASLPVFDQILKKDLLLSYPFDDIATLCDLLDQAAADDRVEAIQMSLYRVSKNSRIVNALIAAAKQGKKVTCVVELRARFDEENNIDWSIRLEQAGCRVVYGLANYKVHCKLLLIDLKDGRSVVQVGTGNFNEVTAGLYTDLALFTAHAGIIADVKDVFWSLQNGRFSENCKHLLVAPLGLKSGIISLIDNEIAKKQAGKPAGIVLKMNSLTDKELIDKLIEASKAGVKIKMIIRGICCLIPGIPGETENITVRSIVGRFLEHSRIFAFGVGFARKYYISSADFMTRNTTQRVEVAVPVYDHKIKLRLGRILNLGLRDNQKARILRKDGRYTPVITTMRTKPLDSQMALFEEAGNRKG